MRMLTLEEAHLRRIDAAIAEAERVMDLADITEASLDIPEGATPEDVEMALEEAHMRAYEDRFHCGTCTVRTVLETVWPSIEAYIEYLKHAKETRLAVP